MTANLEWTPARIERLKAYVAEGLTGGEIGDLMGLTRSAVIGKARRLGLRLGQGRTPERQAEVRQRIAHACSEAHTFWTGELIDLAFKLYIADRMPAEKAAETLGCARATLMTLVARKGWRRASGVGNWQRFGKPASVADFRGLNAQDQDLVADFLARKGVTKLPEGTACGLSKIETDLYAARPMSKNHQDWLARKAARKGRAA